MTGNWEWLRWWKAWAVLQGIAVSIAAALGSDINLMLLILSGVIMALGVNAMLKSGRIW